jgi:hypothetical protein
MHELGLAIADGVCQRNKGQKRFSLGCGILGLAAQPECLYFGERIPKRRWLATTANLVLDRMHRKPDVKIEGQKKPVTPLLSPLVF